MPINKGVNPAGITDPRLYNFHTPFLHFTEQNSLVNVDDTSLLKLNYLGAASASCVVPKSDRKMGRRISKDKE